MDALKTQKRRLNSSSRRLFACSRMHSSALVLMFHVEHSGQTSGMQHFTGFDLVPR